jgi:hypothetical protein
MREIKEGRHVLEVADNGRLFLKMCVLAKELQYEYHQKELQQLINGDWHLWCECYQDRKIFFLDLPLNDNIEHKDRFQGDSPEQVLLQGVMYQINNKTWNRKTEQWEKFIDEKKS